MAWTNRLTQLNDILGDLVPNKEGITRFMLAAGLKPQFINTDGNVLDVWCNVLSEADKRNKVDKLVSAVLDAYPENPYLLSALDPAEINYALSPDLDKISDWKGVDNRELEALTYRKSTLLPISFLEQGILRSRAVGKIEILMGREMRVGTGFLFKIKEFDEVFFMTNHHVINHQSMIDYTRIIFDFELDIDGNSRQSKSYNIKKNGPWYTSPIQECDATIFRLDATDDELISFNPILIHNIDVAENDFVNIIQHPGGQMKQISLYHNIITNTTDRVIQYLTDTLKGSSGSPVFNSNWDVVALHHSGGNSKEDEPKLPIGFKSRNEGILINKIIDFFKVQYQKY